MPVLRSGRLFFLTLRPQEDLCTTGGSSFIAAVNPWTGGSLGEAVFDINRDNQLNSTDIAGGIKIGAADGFAILTGVPNNRIIASQSDASNPQSLLTVGDTIKRGRISWRQVQK
jgi:type IV pilus assembly protein PilY1